MSARITAYYPHDGKTHGLQCRSWCTWIALANPSLCSLLEGSLLLLPLPGAYFEIKVFREILTFSKKIFKFEFKLFLF